MVIKKYQSQTGTTMLLTLVFLLGLFAAIALATDSGNLVVNKTFLQNALDAAALSAALTLNEENDTGLATAAGQATFNAFATSSGNSRLNTVTDLNFAYGNQINPFANDPAFGPSVVRATASINVAPVLGQIIGVGTNNIGAISTAGAISQNCELVPLVI